MKRKLNYFWRLFATGYCFISFSLGGLILSTTVFPIINACISDRKSRKEKIQYAIHLCFKAFIQQMKLLGVICIEIQGRERLVKSGNMIVIANHPSLIDVVVLISLLPRIDCVVKRGLWTNPFLKGVVRGAEYISNSNPENLVDECVSTLKEGNSLLIFPEGTRSVPDKPLKFKRGAAIIAIMSQKPIVPVVITIDPTTLIKSEKWYQIPERKFCYKITVREQLKIDPSSANCRSLNLMARKVTEFLENYYLTALETTEIIINERCTGTGIERTNNQNP